MSHSRTVALIWIVVQLPSDVGRSRRAGLPCEEETPSQPRPTMCRWMRNWMTAGPWWVVVADEGATGRSSMVNHSGWWRCHRVEYSAGRSSARSRRHRGWAVRYSFFLLEVLSWCSERWMTLGQDQAQAKDLTGVGDFREAQVDVPLSLSHFCISSHSWALW